MKFWLAALIAIGCCRPLPAWAQPSGSPLPARVTLEDVLQLLEERSPRTMAGRASVAVAAADRITAETLPNPTVSYGGVHLVSGLSTGATTQHQFALEQPLLMFRQRQARLESANANVNAEEARVAGALAARRLSVRSAFASLLSRQEQLRILETSVEDLERLQQLVRGRAAAGDRSRYDVTRVEIETESLRVQAMNASADVEDAAGQLAVLLGFPGWSPRAIGALEVPSVLTDVEQLWTTAQQRRPSLVVLRRQQAASRAGFLVARRERLPVPAITGGVQPTRDVNGTSVLFGVSIPLPFFDRNQGALAKANAEITAADLELQAGLAEARAEIESAVVVLTKRKDALRVFEGAVTERVPSLRRMAEDAYREGSADILELLDANRSLRDLQLERVQQLEAAKLAEEALISAAALDVAPPAP